MKKGSDNVFKKPDISTYASTNVSFKTNGDSNSVPLPTQAAELGRRQYVSTDLSPYLIHVQRTETSPNDGTYLHPITFGNFLKKNSFKNIIPGSVKRIGRNRCTVSFSTIQDANGFVNDNKLKDFKMRAFIPTFNVTRLGIVRGVPAEWTPEEIKENVTVPIGCGQIIKIRRLNYKVYIDGSVIWKPSQSVVFTFDGQVLPKRVYICYNALPVELYTYPTIQCYNCCRYGHTKLNCRSRPRCFKCSQEHKGETCNIDESCAVCLMCSGHHYATNKICPEFNRQREIKLSMSHSCISYNEASKLHPAISKSYADVLRTKQDFGENNINNRLDTPYPQSTSYKKTVFIKPRPPSSNNTIGYDQRAHNKLINDYNMPHSSTNGTAFKQNKDDNSQNTTVIDLIISFLNSLLTNHTLKPTNVAIIVEMITNLINNNNGSKGPTMELQECSA